jgi:hypothetical protein
MGSSCSSNSLEDSGLDEIYGWEAFLACPTDETSAVKFHSFKDLCPITTNSSSLDQWLDLSA